LYLFWLFGREAATFENLFGATDITWKWVTIIGQLRTTTDAKWPLFWATGINKEWTIANYGREAAAFLKTKKGRKQ
jgi:hypothetical protein